MCINGSELTSLRSQVEDGCLLLGTWSLKSLKFYGFLMFEYKGGRKKNSWKESGTRRKSILYEIILTIFTEYLDAELNNHYLCNKRMDRYMFNGTVLVFYPVFLLCWVVEESKSCRKGWSWGDMKLLSGFAAWQKSKFPEALKFYRYLSLKVMACRCSKKNLRTKIQGIK